MGDRNRQWFDEGYESFVRTYPAIAERVPYHPFYVCPQCLKAYPESVLESGWLTREDVPPRSVGGEKIVLTCRACNNVAGHEMDADMRREADVLDFSGKRPAEIAATLRTAAATLPIRMKVTEGGTNIFLVPSAAPPEQGAFLTEELSRASLPDGWQDFSMKITFRPYSHQRAEASWLRSAYLAFFAALGYRFVVRRELDIVRQRIANPGTRSFTFRIVRPEPTNEPLLTVIKLPEAFRSFAMVYGHHVVFLPMYGDAELYSRLQEQPAGEREFKTEGTYPFPRRPLFLHDVKSRGTESHPIVSCE